MNDTIHVFLGAGPRVGKTTMAKRFAEEHDLKHGSTSDVVMASLCLELQRCHLKSECGFTGTKALIRQIKRNKESFRWLLEAVGDRICRDNPLGLAGVLIDEGCTVVDGIRRWKELNKLMATYNVVTHWVTRPGYPKKRDNTNIGRLDFEWDEEIINDYEGES